MIVRPSWKDVATQFVFETLLAQNLGHYAQLVRWSSEAIGESSMDLNRVLIQNVKQAIVFCADETFKDLQKRVNPEQHHYLTQRLKKYGTGLPLMIVSKEADIEDAARKILEGARLGNGKFCLSHGPVLVQETCYEPFKQKLVALASELRAADLGQEADLGFFDPEEMQQLQSLLQTFGGRLCHGGFEERSMDLLILEDVPKNSPILYQEFPGTLLGLIPFADIDEVLTVAQNSLKANHREAWTAVDCFVNDGEYRKICEHISSYLFLRNAVTASPQFIFPHQGSYFATDLMRRQTMR